MLRAFLPPMGTAPDPLRPAPPNPANASAFTLLSFNWMMPTVAAGRVRPLEDEDVTPLADKFRCVITGRDTFQPMWRKEVGVTGTGIDGRRPKLFRALIRSFGLRLFLSACLKVGNDVCIFVSPLVLRVVRCTTDRFSFRTYCCFVFWQTANFVPLSSLLPLLLLGRLFNTCKNATAAPTLLCAVSFSPSPY